MNKTIVTSGKRKRAVARAAAREGKGVVKINNVRLDLVMPVLYRMRMQEPLVLAKDVASKLDIDVRVNGGGMSSQADAIRLAIAKCIVAFTKDVKIKKDFIAYDRQLLVADVRRKEPAKPNRHSQARAKVQKSYR